MSVANAARWVTAIDQIAEPVGIGASNAGLAEGR
jgi:hypothetical protein